MALTVCTHLRIRFIIIFALLFFSCRVVVCIESKVVDFYEFRAFADFLAQQHLKHAIVAYNGKSLKSLQQQHVEHISKDEALRALFNITTLRFYDVQHAENANHFTYFRNLFFYDATRVGIYLTELEDPLLQAHVLGTNNYTNAFSSMQPVEMGYPGCVFLRFNNSKAWFIMSKAQSVSAALSNIREVMTPLSINISADITFGVRSDDDNIIELFDIYKVQNNLLEIEDKGYWSSTKGLQLKKRFFQSFVRRRRDLRGLRIRGGIAVVEKPDNMNGWDYINTPEYKRLDQMQRKTFQMLRMLEPMFNISFQVDIGKIWGTHFPNGSFDGILQMLLTGELAISMCPMRFRSRRVRLFQYSPAIHTECVRFLFRHPKRNIIRNIFFEPFMAEVWYSVLAIIILTTLLLLLQLHHEQRFVLNKNPHFQCRFDYAVLSIMEAFFMQGPDNSAFASTSTRMLIFFVCLFSLLLQQFYGAFIVGSLLSIPPRTITTMEALYNSSLEIGMENIPYNVEIFENANRPIINDVYTRKICNKREQHVLKIERGAERIKKGGFAFHVSINRMYYLLKEMLAEREYCELQEISFLPDLHIGIGIRKVSPFREHISSSIIMWRTTGLMHYSDRKWAVPKTDCSLSDDREVEVDLQHFLPALFMLCSGMLISVGILVIEIIYYHFERGFNFARFCPNLISEPHIEFTN